GEPDDRVVLRGRHRETIRSDDGNVEVLERIRRGSRRHRAPEGRAEPNHEVDPAHRRSRLMETGEGARERPPACPVPKIELEVRVRGRAEREDPALRRAHRAMMVRTRRPVQPGYGAPRSARSSASAITN